MRQDRAAEMPQVGICRTRTNRHGGSSRARSYILVRRNIDLLIWAGGLSARPSVVVHSRLARSPEKICARHHADMAQNLKQTSRDEWESAAF
jgi:hypothetical protein